MKLKPRSTYFSFILLFILSLPSVKCQVEWNRPTLSIDESSGLSSTYFRKVFSDHNGFIWILTYTGLCRFDGNQTYCIQDELLPAHGFVDAEYDEARELIWLANRGSIYSYDIIRDRVSIYLRSNWPNTQAFRSIELDEDVLWISSDEWLGTLNFANDTIIGRQVTKAGRQFGNSISTILDFTIDPNNSSVLWICGPRGLYSYDMKTSKVIHEINEVNGLQMPFSNIHYDPTLDQFIIAIGNQPGNTYPVNFISFDPVLKRITDSIIIHPEWQSLDDVRFNNDVIALNTSKGIGMYNTTTKQIVKISGEAYPNIRIRAIDEKNRIWTTSTTSLSMYDKTVTQSKHFKYESKEPRWYHIIADMEFKDHFVYLLVYGGEGLYQFDLHTNQWKIFSIKTKEGKVKQTNFHHIHFDSDGMGIVIGKEGFYSFDGENLVKKELSFGEITNWTKAFVDSYNILWSGSSKGIVKIDLNTNSVQYITDEIYFCNTMISELHFFEDSQNNVWIGGQCGGYNVYDREHSEFHAFPLNADDLNDRVVDFDEQVNEVWALCGNGKIQTVSTQNFNTENSTMINLYDAIKRKEIQISGIDQLDEIVPVTGKFDQEGQFWFITNDGLFKYMKSEKRIEVFTDATGLQFKDPAMNVFVARNLNLLQDGRMIYGTRKMITIFDPKVMTNQLPTPKAFIESVEVDNKPIKIDSSSLFKRNYHFAHDENYIAFSIGTLSYNNQKNDKIRYRLIDSETDWKDPGDRRYIAYTNLNGGDYEFQVQAANESGTWPETPESIQFTIDKIWYKRAWAKGLFIALLLYGSLSYFITKFLRALEKERINSKFETELAELKMQALTAQMNPHFIFNSLNSIDYYIIKNNVKKASQYLNRFSNLIRLILKNSRSNYITLQDELDTLSLYMEIEALRFSQKFIYTISVEKNIDKDYIKIPPMLIQPYIENAIWHGLSHHNITGKISVDITLNEEDILTCIIQDNGIGRKKSNELNTMKRQKSHKSFGMNITKDKIDVLNQIHGINASVEIIDLLDQNNKATGTKVVITIPV